MYRTSALDELNGRIARLHAALAEREGIAAQLHDAHGARARLATRVREQDALLRALEQEIARLENPSLSRLFHTLRGDREVQLAHRREALATAQREHERASAELQEALAGLCALKRRLDELGDVDRLYARALAEKEWWLRSHDDASATMLGATRRREHELRGRLQQVETAAAAGQLALSALDVVTAELSALRSWSRREVPDADCVSLRSHKRVRDVFGRASAAQQALRSLRTECRELDGVLARGIRLDLDQLAEYADGFFERILGDAIAEASMARTAGYVAEIRAWVLRTSRILVQYRQKLSHQLVAACAHRHALLEP